MTAPPTALGESLRDRYLIDRGAGATARSVRGGTVTSWLARDLRHRRTVAVNLLSQDLTQSVGREECLREIRRAAQLDHPNILPIFEVGKTDAAVWYVTPYAAAEPLRSRLERSGGIPVSEALALARETAEALDYAHTRGVVHGNVTADHILVADGHARVTGFGLASETGDWLADLRALAQLLREMTTGELSPELSAAVDALQPPASETSESVARFRTAIGVRRPLASGAGRSALPGPAPQRRGIQLTAAVLLGLALAGWAFAMRSSTTAPHRLAVAPFENRTGNSALDPIGAMIADWVTQGLLQTRLVELVEPRAMHPQGESVDLRELARRNGAGIVLTGSYYRLGDSLVFQAALTDVRTTQVLRALPSLYAPAATPTEALEGIRQHTLAAVAAIVDRNFAHEGMGGQPPRYDAYRAWIRAVELHWLVKDGALDAARQAAALDSNFVAPLFYIAGYSECRVADSIRGVLARRWNALSRRDRLAFRTIGCRPRDPDELYRAGRAIAEDARSPDGWFDFALTAQDVGHPHEAVRLLKKVDPETHLGGLPSDKRAALYTQRLARAHVLAGDPKQALAVLDRAWDVSDPRDILWVPRAWALSLLGREEDLLALAASRPAQGLIPYWYAAGRLGAAGHVGAARRVAERGLAWGTAQGFNADTARYMLSLRADLLMQAGRMREASVIAGELVRGDSTDADALGQWGITALLTGDTTTARAADARLAMLPQPGQDSAPAVGMLGSDEALRQRARIAAVAGDSAGAVRLARELLAAHGRSWWRLTVDWVLRNRLREYRPFEEVVRPKG